MLLQSGGIAIGARMDAVGVSAVLLLVKEAPTVELLEVNDAEDMLVNLYSGREKNIFYKKLGIYMSYLESMAPLILAIEV